MQSLLSLSLAIYLIFYVFEGLIRYGFHLAGADSLIFIRDAVLMLPLLLIFLQQLIHRQVHPAYILFAGVIVLHGLVMILNIGSVEAVAYGAKMLITLVAGAVGMNVLLRPSKGMLVLVVLLWSVSWAGVFLDKYYLDMPWVGMEASIGDMNVEISRDWMVSGADKRAGGFMRSSINVASIMPMLALIIIFNLKRLPVRIIVALLTIPALIWTTQKGAIIAYVFTLGLLVMRPQRPLNILRIGLCAVMVLAIALPQVFEGYTMPQADGVFSLSSFYLRIEWMWPGAWAWIHAHEAFPFGVGLGGIGGAQRLYAPIDDMNAADNIFVLMYAYFGVMTFVYLGAVLVLAAKVRNDGTPETAQAMAMLVFLFGYGCVISLLEDQAATLFMGAALACLCAKVKSQREEKDAPQVQGATAV